MNIITQVLPAVNGGGSPALGAGFRDSFGGRGLKRRGHGERTPVGVQQEGRARRPDARAAASGPASLRSLAEAFFEKSRVVSENPLVECRGHVLGGTEPPTPQGGLVRGSISHRSSISAGFDPFDWQFRRVERAKLRRVSLAAEAHACAREQFTLQAGGELCLLKRRGVVVPPVNPAPRACIRAFSKKSARRLKDLFALAAVLGKPLAVTLTYHENFLDEQESKRHLDLFGKRFRRRWPSGRVIWVREYQRRGAVHYHLAVWGSPGLLSPSGREWLSRSWWEITGQYSEEHLKGGTQVSRVRKSVAGYYSKYCQKNVGIQGRLCLDDQLSLTGCAAVPGLGQVAAVAWMFRPLEGRCWGTVGDFSDVDAMVFSLSEKQYTILRRTVTKAMLARGLCHRLTTRQQLAHRLYLLDAGETLRFLADAVFRSGERLQI